jgi:hypothetical protein
MNTCILDLLAVTDSSLLPDIAAIPDFGLYMDQCLQFVNSYGPRGPLVSAHMVNNYVKAGILPPPENRKYYRSHIVCLLLLSRLKSVSSLSSASFFLASMGGGQAFYDSYTIIQEYLLSAKSRLSTLLSSLSSSVDASSPLFSLLVSLDASLLCLVSDSILPRISDKRPELDIDV